MADHEITPIDITIPTVEQARNSELGMAIIEETIPDVSINDTQEYMYPIPVKYAFLYDFSSGYTDYTSEANEATADDVPLLPSPIGVSDAFLVGFEDDSIDTVEVGDVFSVMFNITTAGTGTYNLVWKYWDGDSWEPVTILYDGTYAWKVTGHQRMTFLKPADIAKTTANGQNGYFIQINYNAGTVVTQPLAGQMWINPPPTPESAGILWWHNI